MICPPDSEMLDFLHKIETTAARAADLCKQMLAYAGKSRFVASTIDLSQLVREMADLLKVSISKKALLRSDLAGHSNQCILAYWHHARFSSGHDGDNSFVQPFWQALV